ncbi:MAG: hypothetical protein ABIQ89_00430 [Candidatus Saccharimonadales bacterium]
MKKLLKTLREDFPHVQFTPGETFSWSSRKQTICYPVVAAKTANAAWSLLHEMGHAVLNHTTYQSDFELVKLEAAAWDKAAELGQKYGHIIDVDHIQDCLDTYRDWLHQRSTCPQCLVTSLQRDMHTYCCYNCNTQWRVSRSKLCRPYRLLQKETALS